MHRILQPDGWKRPAGYANGMTARGRQVFVAGQIGWDAQERIVGDDFIAQLEQALRNVVAVLRAGDAGPEHIARMTWYLADREEFNARGEEIGAVYRKVIGPIFPAMTAIQVSGFVEPAAKVEIEVTAVVPD